MCGISGIISRDGRPIDAGALQRMDACLAHRGPDGRGFFSGAGVALGHRRLSILDPTPAGAQPMHRGNLVLSHNGEVYNYLELAAQLQDAGVPIETGTDTEVILAAYATWGLDCLARFNGMFAFAIWDGDRRRLILVRDRLGVKPLYLRRTASATVFSSEIPALIASRPVHEGDGWQPEPHLPAVHDFLTQGRTDHSANTFIDGVTALPPGHALVIEDGSERLIRYWPVPPLAEDGRARVRGSDARRDQATIEEFRALFDSSVRLRLRSDVSLGSCLSGGLDSSSIVLTVAHLLRESGQAEHEQAPRVAFHARAAERGIDESHLAALVAARAGVRLVVRTPSGAGLLAMVADVLRAQGEPYDAASVHAQYGVMEAAHGEGIKVLLDGQGADELLGGYVHYGGVVAAGLLRSGQPRAALRELRGQVHRGSYRPVGALVSGVRASLPAGLLERIRARSGGRLGIRVGATLAREPHMDAARPATGTRLARRLWHATSVDGLPTLLRYEDRNSMRWGIEARVPFLDFRLVELAMRLPDRLRIHAGVNKLILRRAMADRLPIEIADRRDKLGFTVPQRAWLDGSRADVAQLLRQGQVLERAWVDPAEVDRLVEPQGAGRRQTDQLWRLFVTEMWLRMTWPRTGDRVEDLVAAGRAADRETTAA